MQILQNKITKADLLNSQFVFDDGPMIKAVVDIEKNLVAIDSELHADLEKLLLENGSHQDFLWGINLYPQEEEDYFVEFDSMINIRPRQGNRTRSVEDEAIQKQIIKVVNDWIA